MRGGTTVELGDGTLLESILPRAVGLIGEFHEADLGGVAERVDDGAAVKVSVAPTDTPGHEVSVHRSPPSTDNSMNAYALSGTWVSTSLFLSPLTWSSRRSPPGSSSPGSRSACVCAGWWSAQISSWAMSDGAT